LLSQAVFTSFEFALTIDGSDLLVEQFSHDIDQSLLRLDHFARLI